MPIARKMLLDLANPGWVHCISRCVRRAFLTGKDPVSGRDLSHRRQWAEDRLKELAATFACDVAAFAVMSNHVHIVVRMQPEAVATWSSVEVATRWAAIFGTRLPRSSDGRVRSEVIDRLSRDAAWIEERRRRLSDLSWFMRAFSESIAVRANAEDECRGRFWEGRFTSVAILDQAALIACMAYVDLNPVRAGIVDRPEQGRCTSFRQRVVAAQRQRIPRKAVITESARKIPAGVDPGNGGRAMPPPPDLWIAPMTRCVLGDPARAGVLGQQVLNVDEYLHFVDFSGRIVREGKSGRIPPDVAPLLSRLGLRPEDWKCTLEKKQSMNGTLGHVRSRAAEAVRRGVSWVRNRCPLFRAPSAGVTAA